MPDLNFEVVGAEVPAHAAVPTLIFKLRIVNMPVLSEFGQGERNIHSIALRSQVQLEVTRRHYTPEMQEKLLEVFGEPQRWGETLRTLLWTHANVVVPAFGKSIIVDLPISCTYDFEVTSTKYFAALSDGDIPLNFLFSGTIFYESEEGMLQIAQVPWSKEARFRLPVSRWQEMMARYFPNTNWLRLHNDVFDQLYRYKVAQGMVTWEEVLTRLLASERKEV